MNAYAIRTTYSVKHNGKFVCNNFQNYIVHARSSDEAKSKISLAPATKHELPKLIIESSAEWITCVKSLGTVKIKPFYVYSGDNPPVSVENFKKMMIYKTKRGN
jgi:hypothetical protein